MNGQIIAESNSGGTITAEYVYLNGQPLAKMEGANTYYYHNDHLGTPQKMADSSGTAVWAADYKPFGEAAVTVSTITNNLRFPGQYFDAETGLNYNYYRDYNPVIGRYIEVDPIGLEGGGNLFLYSEGNPINLFDPFGLYNRDTHYDLTRKMSLEVGFKSCAADVIAGADQGVDDNPETDWKSRKKRELWHFPSKDRVDEVIKKAMNSCNLSDLGKALHVLQDSFSHTGYPAWRGHFPITSVDDPKSDQGKYNNMIRASKDQMNKFSKKCGFGCCK